MLTQTIIFLLILFVLLLWLYNRQRIRYWVELLYERGLRSTVHYDRCLKLFMKLYEDVDAMQVSIKQRKEMGIYGDTSYTYGEVKFFSFLRILEKTDPKPGEIFYDLGSGGGKAVFIAGIVFDFAKACGIEKLAALYDLSLQLVEKLKTLPEAKALHPDKKFNIEFVHGDILQENFSDGDIVFVNATCFIGEMFDAITAKLLKLKVGARVILGSADLDNVGGFKQIYSNLHLMSWGLSNVSIYERI